MYTSYTNDYTTYNIKIVLFIITLKMFGDNCKFLFQQIKVFNIKLGICIDKKNNY